MHQPTFSDHGFDQYRKKARKERFLEGHGEDHFLERTGGVSVATIMRG